MINIGRENVDLTTKQIRFNKMFFLLLKKAEELGYDWIIGWAYRPPDIAEELGFKNSLHTICLAIDLELFKDGEYLIKTEDHLPLGEYWESLGGSWGGRFDDGNHYSLEHGGRK